MYKELLDEFEKTEFKDKIDDIMIAESISYYLKNELKINFEEYDEFDDLCGVISDVISEGVPCDAYTCAEYLDDALDHMGVYTNLKDYMESDEYSPYTIALVIRNHFN